MLRIFWLIILILPFTAISQECYPLNDGKGLFLFSPFLGSSPRVKKQHKGYSFGDTTRASFCNDVRKKSVIGIYETPEDEPVFAAHGGIVSVYTSVNTSEGNQANDALWIDGGNITTNYIGLIPAVQTGQYVYAGQTLGKIFRDKYASIFGFGVRLAAAFNPIHKRGYLPSIPDGNGKCECNGEPVWPEYFVNPASRYIAYDRYNDFLPEASIHVNISPSGVGQWSFDNGVTWLNGGDKVSGLPFGHYNIIFKNEYGYTSPVTYKVKIYSTNKNLLLNADYTPDYTILKKPDALLQREADEKLLDEKLDQAMDSLSLAVYGDEKNLAFKNSILDSLNTRFSRIEDIQKETFFMTRLFKYILPLLLLAMLFALILLFQNSKIRRQKKYLENLQKEQHHRVHNSLGLVSSLLNKFKNNITPEKLADIDNSIVAISTVHRQLYKGNDLEQVNFQPVAENIIQSLLAQRGLDDAIDTYIDANIMIPQKKSTTLALMVNELITNSIKYAFQNVAEKKIYLSASNEKDGILVVYSDNGKGYSTDFLKQNTDGFGRVMLNGLANQLRAKIHFYNENGACCMIKF